MKEKMPKWERGFFFFSGAVGRFVGSDVALNAANATAEEHFDGALSTLKLKGKLKVFSHGRSQIQESTN